MTLLAELTRLMRQAEPKTPQARPSTPAPERIRRIVPMGSSDAASDAASTPAQAVPMEVEQVRALALLADLLQEQPAMEVLLRELFIARFLGAKKCVEIDVPEARWRGRARIVIADAVIEVVGADIIKLRVCGAMTTIQEAVAQQITNLWQRDA